jgi:integrase
MAIHCTRAAGGTGSRHRGVLPSYGELSSNQLPLIHRSAEFRRRCSVAAVSGVSLHSYRHAWAQRAKNCGYPQRFAQEALGHNSRAVHEAYTKSALVILPALDEYEQTQIPKAIPFNYCGLASRIAPERRGRVK